MRRTLSLLLLVLFAAPTLARPVERDRLPGLQAEPTAVPLVPQSGPGLETYFFGGTVWAPDSMRWEAVPDSIWTFETGVGSHFQHTDPNKNPAFHASMEGWTGVDLTRGSPSQRFRRLSADDFAPYPACVGSPAGLGGNYSFWAGLLESEADSLCWAAGQGYGDYWNICIHKDFSYDGGCLHLSYDFRNETEAGYDYTYVLIDTSGASVAGGEVLAQYYTGVVDGSGGQQIDLTPGVTLPGQAGPIRISFCLVSDGGYSDEDGGNPTVCGAFAVDDIVLSNAACGGSFLDESTFETGTDGWEVAAEGYPRAIAGDWSRLAAVADLPPLPDSLGCDFGDSVLVLFDPDGPYHPYHQDNLAVSPWIDLRRAGKVGYPGKFVEVGGYRDLPLENFIFAIVRLQWYPDTCEVTGKVRMSDFSESFFFYTPNGPWCGSPPSLVPFGNIVSMGAEQVRIGIGVVNYCRFYGGACTGMGNTSPWFDNIRFEISSFNGIQYALDRASDGDTVWVPPGTYAASSFDFKGKNVVLKSVAGPETTIIDGQRQQRAFVFQTGEDSTAVVEGFTIRNCGAPPDEYPEDSGGAVYIEGGSSPTFLDCRFLQNHGYRGGAVYVTGGGAPTFRECEFSDNFARYGGGAVYTEYGTAIRILDCTLSRNSGDPYAQSVYGGALYISNTPTVPSLIEDCTLEENAGSMGGALLGDHIVVRRSSFLNNTAQGDGGGASIRYGTVEDCGFAFNVSGNGAGGGLHATLCDITRSAFFANQASRPGGGVFASGCRLFDCRIENNSASSGGGILLTLASQTQFSYVRSEMHGCILRSNHAEYEGGGAYSEFFNFIEGGKIVGNSANQGGGIYSFSYEIYWFDPPLLTVTGTEITGNSADTGGGCHLATCDRPMLLESATIAGNHARVGGGIYYSPCSSVLGVKDTLDVNRTVLFANCADSSGGTLALPDTSAIVTFTCCNVDTFGISGPGTIVYDGFQVYQNPEFCSPTPCYLAPTIAGIYALAESSPDLPAHNACGVLIGALGEGCSIVEAPREEEPPVLAPAMTVSANPFRETLAIHYEAPEGTEPVLRVYDVRGALVQDLPIAGSRGTATWDGRSRSGASAPSGVYFLQLVAGNDRRSLRVVRMR